MKCGREIKDQQVFCPDCLAKMEDCPIDPNVTVRLPVRPAVVPAKKKSRRHRDAKPEDQVRYLKLVIRCLAAALAVSLAAFALVAGLLLTLINQRDQTPNIGQNYGTIGSVAP